MIIQCAADFHGNREKYRKFFSAVEREEPDVLIFPGDLGYIEEESYDISIPSFAVHGNMDGLLFLKKIKIVDDRLFSFKDARILGLGWNFKDTIDNEGRIMRIMDAKFDIVISHAPPYKTKDRSFIGMHIGSKKLRHIMEEKKPSLILCGHVHEDYGYGKFGDTMVVNCSIGKKGEYTIIDTSSHEVRMVGY